MKKQMLTLSYALKRSGGESEILLGLKKRGFGKGRWNGFGGKVDDGETTEGAAVREFFEETGLMVKQSDLEKVAIVDFYFRDGKELRVYAFFTYTWTGEPKETEEMRPQWFAFKDIPYDDMWVDDIHWLPRVLKGEKISGSVWFGKTDEEIEKMEWKEVHSLY